MKSPQQPDPDRAGADTPSHAARLRDRIDHGAAGDKVSYPDPAAAPLGTDDEAAGTPLTAEQVRLAEAEEARGPARPSRRSDPLRPTRPAWVLWAVLTGVLVLVLLVYVGWP